MTSYEPLLTAPVPHVAETIHPYLFLTERHLQAMWFEQKYFKNLKTASGESVEVISPGIWNAEAGPDFLKAHLKIGASDVHGDIEIHFTDESWQQHQHHIDERYNSVVLHLSLWPPKTNRSIIRADGISVQQAYLEPFLTISHARILQLIDLELYPYKRFLGSGRCARELFFRMPESKIKSFFQDAAEWRLKQKRNYFSERIENKNMQLISGIAMALGYKNNAEAFLELFIALLDIPFDSQERALAAALYCSGFFSKHFYEKWEKSDYYLGLHNIAEPFTKMMLPSFKLVLSQIRPYNHPVRRLAVLSKLLYDGSLHDSYSRMITIWENAWQDLKQKKAIQELYEQFLSLIPTYQDEYWNWHYIFETGKSNVALTLIGEDLKTIILVNTFLPLLYDYILQHHSEEQLQAFRAFYSYIPATKSSKTEYLIHRFFGDTQRAKIFNKAFSEQGAYQLHRDFCMHYEASCEGCPFVDRMKTCSHEY